MAESKLYVAPRQVRVARAARRRDGAYVGALSEAVRDLRSTRARIVALEDEREHLLVRQDALRAAQVAMVNLSAASGRPGPALLDSDPVQDAPHDAGGCD
jgi:hypothetical protein